MFLGLQLIQWQYEWGVYTNYTTRRRENHNVAGKISDPSEHSKMPSLPFPPQNSPIAFARSNATSRATELKLWNKASSKSSTLRHDAAPTPALDDVPHDVRVCHFAAHAAACVGRVVGGGGVAVAQLRHEALDGRVVGCVGVGAQEARQVVDVAAGEADEGEGFCVDFC